ncbi:MAG: ABC transporter ATP-binding protein [Planctomycetes bacterium]|nr:ABC transporter ATP-binding protein [Planctomycetota bacterium]
MPDQTKRESVMVTRGHNLMADGDDPSDNVKVAALQQERFGVRMVSALRRTIAETKGAIACIRAVAIYCYSYKYRFLLLALLSPILSIPPLLTPLIMQLLIDKAYPARDFRLFGWLCAALLALRMVPSLLISVSGYLSKYIENMLQYKLCFRVFNAIQRLPQSYLEEHGSGMFLERATRDVGSVARSITQLVPQIVTIAFTFLAAIFLMLRLDVGITLLILAIVPVNFLITARLARRLRSFREAERATDEKITTFTSETIEGTMIARLFYLSRFRRKRLKQLLREHLRIVFATWRASMFWGQLSSLISITWGMVLLCGGWYLVFTNRLQLGEAVALGMYVNIVVRPFEQLAKIYELLMTSSVSARRILEILNARHSAVQGGTPKTLVKPPSQFELHKISFAYKEGRTCLCDLDLCLKAGRTVAVVGPSGAGKSTLIRILSGLDNRYQGRFLVDGYDFREINHDSYLHHVSLVPQTTFFFSDSIRNNLCSGNGSISTESLQKYASILGLDEMISSTPEGYDTKLGSDGIRLSAGQYQKLAAFRAILKDASILLLDEVTSSMDIESERKLLQGIIALRTPGCVTLLVTHNIAITTEPWIDEVVILVNGRIAERGSCAELREKRGFYHHWLSLDKGISLDRAILVDELSRHEC